MTLVLKNAQTEPVPTAGTSAVTSLSPQERPCTSLTSFSEAEVVRSRPAPPAVYCTRDPIPAPYPRQVAFQLRPDAPAFVPSQPSATRSAPAAEPNESDLLPESWQPWRSTASVLVASFLIALVATSCSAFGLVDATSLALAGGTQPVLYTNTAGDLDVVACHPGICFDPLSDMANGQSSVIFAGIDLLHPVAAVRCDAAGLVPEAVHAKLLPLGLDGFRHPDWHQYATEGMPCTRKSLACMHYLKLPVPTISSKPQLGLHDSGTCSSLAAVKEANLPASFADFVSPLKESASLAEQETATAHAAAPSLRLFALLHYCPCAPRHAASSPPLHAAHTIPALPQLHDIRP